MAASLGLLGAMPVPGAAIGGSGELDPRFDVDGRVTTNVADLDTGNAVAVQADGKIVLAGFAETTGGLFDWDVVVLRYRTDGSLDPSFGGDGKVNTDLGSPAAPEYQDLAFDVAIQSDDKIVVVGSSTIGEDDSSDILILRYMPDGSLDPDFGDAGIVTTDVLNADAAHAVAIQADDSIVVAGSASPDAVGSDASEIALVRYQLDGSLDEGFGDGGIVTTAIGEVAQAKDVALQADGKVVAAGFYERSVLGEPGSTNVPASAIVRYRNDGALDENFADAGILALELSQPMNEADQLDAVAVQPDGKIVAAGWHARDLDMQMVVVRVDGSGTLDETFSNNGIATFSITDFAQAHDLSLQPNGKIVVAGSAGGGGGFGLFAVARLGSSGILDPSFDGDGRVTVTFGDFDGANASAVQEDGKIILAGTTYPGPEMDPNFALARLVGDAPVSPGLVRGNDWRLSNDLDGDVDIPLFEFGKSTDRPIVGDWDGDDDETPGVVRGNVWYLTNASPPVSIAHTFAFAKTSDRPVAADWDGNGTWTPAAVRGNVWFVTNASPPTSIAHTFAFAKASDRPVAGDWDGNGTWTPGVVRGNVWYVSNQMPPQTVESFTFGKSTDLPVVGDWDGDGRWTPGVVRGNAWYLTNEIPPQSIYASFVFGEISDRPVVGDWDVL